MTRLDGETNMIQLMHNMKCLVKFSMSNDLKAYPEFYAYCSNETSFGKWGIFCKKLNEHDKVSVLNKDYLI